MGGIVLPAAAVETCIFFNYCYEHPRDRIRDAAFKYLVAYVKDVGVE
jgi:hypothetical protein